MKHYRPLKQKEGTILPTIQMSLKHIMLSESRQAQKVTSCVIPFVENVHKCTETVSRLVVARGWAGSRERFVSMGSEPGVRKMV